MSSSSPFDIRTATLDDVPQIVALVNSAYRGDSSRAGWTTEADLLGGLRIDDERAASAVAGGGEVVLVHEIDGALAACVHLQRRRDAAYVGMLTTRPTLQGSGIGRQMIDAAERWAVQHWQARATEMTVLVQRHDLISWYERRGYAKTGVVKPFPYGDERWGLPTRDDLAFHVMRKELAVTDRPAQSQTSIT